jgi:hypothetical protein
MINDKSLNSLVTICSGLDNYPSKARVLKSWSPRCITIGGSGIFKRWGLVGSLQVIGGVPLKGDCWVPVSFSFSLFASWSPWGKQLAPPCVSHHYELPHPTGPKRNELTTYGLKSPKLWARITAAQGYQKAVRFPHPCEEGGLLRSFMI